MPETELEGDGEIYLLRDIRLVPNGGSSFGDSFGDVSQQGEQYRKVKTSDAGFEKGFVLEFLDFRTQTLRKFTFEDQCWVRMLDGQSDDDPTYIGFEVILENDKNKINEGALNSLSNEYTGIAITNAKLKVLGRESLNFDHIDYKVKRNDSDFELIKKGFALSEAKFHSPSVLESDGIKSFDFHFTKIEKPNPFLFILLPEPHHSDYSSCDVKYNWRGSFIEGSDLSLIYSDGSGVYLALISKAGNKKYKIYRVENCRG